VTGMAEAVSFLQRMQRSHKITTMSMIKIHVEGCMVSTIAIVAIV
jgi:hypothetical protein